MNDVFPDVIVQKCVFHAIQLLTRGLIKEFTKRKKELIVDHIEEWKTLRRRTLSLEKNEQVHDLSPFKFDDVELAWQIYVKLRNILTRNDPRRIEQELQSFFSSSQFSKWNGKDLLLSKYEDIFTKRKFKFSEKSLKYVVPKIYKAFRAAIRELRKELEESKSHFNKVKYLILMNPINMKTYHRTKLRKYLKEFPLNS